MKGLFFFLTIGLTTPLLAQVSVYDCNALTDMVTQTEIDAAGDEYYRQCILFYDDFEFQGDFNKTILAANTIHIKDDFHAGPFTPQGQLHLKIKPKSDFDVAVMNYPHLNGVLKLEKFELGVKLPEDIDTKVENFVNEAQVSSDQKINPYLDWEIRVYAVFEHPNEAEPIIIDGYYSKEFTSFSNDLLDNNGYIISSEQYKAIGGWNEIYSDYDFRVRFAPTRLGEWKGKIVINIGNNVPIESELFYFNVVESGNPGYVQAGKRFLKLNGETFYPVGCNLPWPVTEDFTDPELAALLSGIDWDGVYRESSEDYRDNYCAPRVYENYKNVMSQIAAGGANYYRSIMYPSATDIEWEELGNYTKRLHMAQEMDEILEHAEELGLYVHWNLQIHYSLQESDKAYLKRWTWDDQIEGNQYCYKTLIGTNNPIDFFTNESAKKYYKQRLRYILSRWGYSTNVAIFELMSEIDNVYTIPFSEYYKTGNNWQTSRNWNIEMATYIKSFYHGRIHLTTASYAGKVDADNVFHDPHFDVMTGNFYDYKEPTFANFFINTFAEKYLNEGDNLLASYTYQNEKPLISSESGPGANDPFPAASCDYNVVEMQRNMWQSMFSGLAGSIPWDLRKHPHIFPVFGQMKSFISQIELENDRWHPGASELIDNSNQQNWYYNDDYSKYMDGDISPLFNGKRVRKADLSYLRSGDGNFAIGVLTNKTYNIYTTDDCFDSAWDLFTENYSSEPIESAASINCNNEKLKFSGMNNGKYYLTYFNIYNQNNPDFSDEDYGPKLKMKYTISDNLSDYIILVKARKKNFNWIPVVEDSIPRAIATENKNEKLMNEEVFNIFQEEIQIKIHPVPSYDKINILSNQNLENLKVRILSSDNRSINEIWLSGNDWQIDISTLKPGTYFLEFYVDEINVCQKRIIKL